MVTIKNIKTDELRSVMSDNNLQIIDIRSIDSFNGWKECGEFRNGHIKGARNIPYKWFAAPYWEKIVTSIELIKDLNLVIYGSSKTEIDQVVMWFISLGFKNVFSYYHFTDQWTKGILYPMEFLHRFSKLVPPWWLQLLITKKFTPEYDNNHYVICHCHYQNIQSYLNGHIPEAIELNTNMLESPDTWNRKSPVELKDVFEKLGISPDTTVILYGEHNSDENTGSYNESDTGQLAAFRCALIMLYAGIKDVRILNGGLSSWISEGYDLSRNPTQNKTIKQFLSVSTDDSRIFIDQAEAKNYLNEEDKNLISIRSWPEYIGEASGYNYISQKGRIPGALFSNCGSDAYHMENYRNPDQTCREYKEILKMWDEAGIQNSKDNAFYCGTGWKASEAWFNAYLMGWSRISVYDGGWYEWSLNLNNPIETGIPEKSD